MKAIFMGYYISVFGDLICENIKEVIEILKNLEYLDENDFEIKFDQQFECECPLCGNRHLSNSNKGIISFDFCRKGFLPNDFKPLSSFCEGILECRGEEFDDIFKIKFENKKIKIIKVKWVND